jgi:sigma-E factor negative regulatory protein RseA
MSEQLEQQRQQWSVLMDGEADSPVTAALCARWRGDAEARRTWHAWHLAGDVMRSEDLRSTAARDARFLAALRARLAAEPVVLAPSSAAPRRRWVTAAAVAAGFVAVVGTVVVMDISAPPGTAPVLAQQAPEPVPVRAVPVLAAEPQFVVANGQLIRDARLDRYLAAHKPAGGQRAPSLPPGAAAPRAVEAGYAR